jgi:hypothetical protein
MIDGDKSKDFDQSFGVAKHFSDGNPIKKAHE